jgi:hypothetical protein
MAEHKSILILPACFVFRKSGRMGMYSSFVTFLLCRLAINRLQSPADSLAPEVCAFSANTRSRGDIGRAYPSE